MENLKNPEALNIFGHLDELRSRIIKALLGLAAGTAGGLFVARPIIEFLKKTAVGSVQNYILVKPTEIISIYFKVALYCGAIVASPIIFYQAWKFVQPAIAGTVRVSLSGWVMAAAGLFAAGTAFAYWVLAPQALMFLMGLSREVAAPMINLNNFISFVLAILLVGGAVFEIPVMVGLLTKLNLVTPSLLRKKRKEAIFALCVIAAVITPTTDAFNMIIFVLPMLALYEASIWVSVLLSPARKKSAEDDPYHENS